MVGEGGNFWAFLPPRSRAIREGIKTFKPVQAEVQCGRIDGRTPWDRESNVFKWMQDNRYSSTFIDYKPISMPDYKRFKLKAAEVDYVKKFQDLNETALARLSLMRTGT